MKKLNKINQIREKNKNKEIENCTFKPLTNENVDEFIEDDNLNKKALEMKIEEEKEGELKSTDRNKRSRSKKMQIILKQRDSNKPFATVV